MRQECPISSDPPQWLKYDIVVEFHRQWWERRKGPLLGTGKQAFSRNWEALLQAAKLTSGDCRIDAVANVKELEKAGLFRINSPRLRSSEIQSIQLPVEQEIRFATLFGDPLDETNPKIDFSLVPWAPELSFLATMSNAKIKISSEDLLALNRFFLEGGRSRPVVPTKERSLQIFGDEKRLDSVVRSPALFTEGKLSLAMLQARWVREPLGWRQGPMRNGKFLVLENAATWDSFSQWNQQVAAYAAVIYGAGHRFFDGAYSLHEIVSHCGECQEIWYFGDLDPEGLRIPVAAANRYLQEGFPAPRPLTWAYKKLLEIGTLAMPEEVENPENPETENKESPIAWLGDELAVPVKALFSQKKRIAQEALGWEFLHDLRKEPVN